MRANDPELTLTVSDRAVLSCSCTDRSGQHKYSIHLLFERGLPAEPYRSPESLVEKIGQLYGTSSKYEILFSDYARGDVELFTIQCLDPRATWLEVLKEDGTQVGVMCLTEINPYWDAYGHFSFWDSITRGREELVLRALNWAMIRYSLPRISAEIAAYQKHLRRFAARVGFVQEGIKREAGLRHGNRIDLVMYGILRAEMEAKLNGQHD